MYGTLLGGSYRLIDCMYGGGTDCMYGVVAQHIMQDYYASDMLQ